MRALHPTPALAKHDSSCRRPTKASVFQIFQEVHSTVAEINCIRVICLPFLSKWSLSKVVLQISVSLQYTCKLRYICLCINLYSPFNNLIFLTQVKGKAVQLLAWSDPEGSRKLRLQDYMTTAQDGGKVVSPIHRPPLPPRKCSWYSFLLEAESTPGP